MAPAASRICGRYPGHFRIPLHSMRRVSRWQESRAIGVERAYDICGAGNANRRRNPYNASSSARPDVTFTTSRWISRGRLHRNPDAVGVVSVAGLVGMKSERHGAEPAHAKGNAGDDSDDDYRYADAIDRSRWSRSCSISGPGNGAYAFRRTRAHLRAHRSSATPSAGDAARSPATPKGLAAGSIRE